MQSIFRGEVEMKFQDIGTNGRRMVIEHRKSFKKICNKRKGENEQGVASLFRET